MSDEVRHPKHYSESKIEVLEAIEAWGLINNYYRGTVIKYTARAGKKDPAKEIQDLEKAVWYLKREIEILTAAKENREPLRPNEMNRQVEEKLFTRDEMDARIRLALDLQNTRYKSTSAIDASISCRSTLPTDTAPNARSPYIGGCSPDCPQCKADKALGAYDGCDCSGCR